MQTNLNLSKGDFCEKNIIVVLSDPIRFYFGHGKIQCDERRVFRSGQGDHE
jgi:hypothetical protein